MAKQKDKPIPLSSRFLKSFIIDIINNIDPNEYPAQEEEEEELTESNSIDMPSEPIQPPFINLGERTIGSPLPPKIPVEKRKIRKYRIRKRNKFHGLKPSMFNIKKSYRTLVPKSIKEEHPTIPLTQTQVKGKFITSKTQEMNFPISNLHGMNTFPYPKKEPSSSQTSPNSLNLGKLNFLLSDPNVQEIDCHGPGKNITVRKDGRIQLTPIILSKEEIKNILDDFSKNTRIPVIGGTFKAAFGGLILTAVTSDFVGTHFVIHKRPSFQKNNFN